MSLPRILFFTSSKRGFTLIELMVVMTVVAILATMVLFGLTSAQASARDAARMQIMTGVQAAMERYYGDNGSYPPLSPNSGFCGDISVLITGNYLSSSPVDPKVRTNICTANSGNPTIGGATYGLLGGPAPAGTSCAGIGAAGWSPQVYAFSLAKESGGTVYFCSPR